MVSSNLQEIVAKQKAVLEELEREADAAAHSDLAVENESLKEDVMQLRDSLERNTEKLKQVSAQNAGLKNALHDQIYNEKLKIVNAVLKKSDIYFKAATEGGLNRLTKLENDLRGKTDHLTAEMEKYRVETRDELNVKLAELFSEASEAIAEAKAKIARETGAFTEYSAAEFQRLKDEQITDDIYESIGKKNNLEAFVGGNLINKLGILFVILGIIAVSQFTVLRMPDTVKGIIMFLVSGGLLLAGELLSRKKANIFSLGLTGGGVAGLYSSLSISYFALGIISMYPAIFLCVLVTAGAFALSQRYNSQTVAAFALIGGYIPIVSISESVVLTYGAMVYLVTLNLLALIISFHKKWKITMLIGFFLNLTGTLYIVFNMFRAARIASVVGGPLGMCHALTVLYVIFAFAVYTVIPIISNYRTEQPFGKPDVIVLGLNTILSALILYAVFYEFGLSAYNGLMALAFAAVYIGLGRLMDSRRVKERHTSELFYLTGLTFVVLVVPLQFGRAWLSLGWLAQGVGLAAYGILAEEKNFKKAGFAIGALCLAAFVFFDVALRVDSLLAYKYFAVTFGSVILLASLAYKKSFSGRWENNFKYAVLVNVWLYLLYLVNLSGGFLRMSLAGTGYDATFLLAAMSVAITLIYAALLPWIPVVTDKGTKIISVAVSFFGMFSLMAVTGSYTIISPWSANGQQAAVPVSVTVIAALVLIVLCALAVLSMRNALMFFVLEARLPVEWLPFGVSAYFLVILTQNLIAQYGLSGTSIIISIIYVVAALAWIMYGFVKRFAFMRRFGLGLSVLAVAKLFLIDLPDLTQGYKIVSYFAFGVTLLTISFVYQYFSKRLSPGMEVIEIEIEEDDM